MQAAKAWLMHSSSDLLARLRRTWPALIALLLLAACSRQHTPSATAGAPAAAEVTTLRYQGSVGTVTFPELAEALGYLAPVKLQWIGNTISGPQDIQTVVTGDTDFGTAFNGSIVKLVAAHAPIRAVVGSYGIDEQTWIGFYVLEGSPIRSARDLIGKKIAMNTLGAHTEFVLREYLARAGLTSEEQKQVTMIVVPPVNSEQSLRQQQVEVATLGGILRDKALQRGGIRKLFSDYDLYGPFTAGAYVLRDKFIAANPTTVRRFAEATGRAIEWARNTPREQVRERYEQIIRGRGRNEDATTVRYWLSTGIANPEGRIDDREFQLWIDWLVKDGELKPGQVKPSDLYTNAFNGAKTTTAAATAAEARP